MSQTEPRSQVQSDGSQLPGCWKVSLHFVELKFVIKGHQLDTFLGCVLDVGDLLAGVSIDDPLGGHPQPKDGPDLILGEK